MSYKSSTKLFVTGLCIIIFSLAGCKNNVDKTEKANPKADTETSTDSVFFKLSLAQWSLHPLIFDGELDAMDFAKKASEMGFDGVEYVSTFYSEKFSDKESPGKEMQVILDSLKAQSEQYNIRNVLIMVDGEGDLAVNDSIERNNAVENHKKWIDAANFLGCHSIRINLFGSNEPEEWKANSIDALTKLSKYAAEKDVNILVENHGWLSSNADLLVAAIKEVGMENCGTLPDFGNFCTKREGGERWDAKCTEEYPRYEGVEKMMPYAKAVSAKSYTFDEEGNEDLIDYKKMLQIVKDAGYTGYIGVEFEGKEISPEEGITKTKELLIEAGSEI